MIDNTEPSISKNCGKRTNVKVYIATIVFTLIVGFSFLGVKVCITVANPIEILVHRFNFALLAAMLLVLLRKLKIGMKGKKKSGMFLTALLYVGFMILQTIGLTFSTSVEAGIIFAIIPIIAKIIAGIFLKEKTTWKQNIFVCVSVVAVIALFVCGASDLHVNFLGIIILFLSSLCMAGSNVMMRGVRASFTPTEIAFCIALFGCIVFNLTYVVLGIKNGTLGGYFAPLTQPNFLIAIIYLGIPSTLISSLLISYMLANMEAIKATVFGNLSTAISIMAGIVILKEPMQAYHIICTLLIIIGVVGVSLPSMGKSSSNSHEEKEEGDSNEN